MRMTLFVAGFWRSAKEDDLKDLFRRYGLVESVKIWRDWETGEAKGWGFVEMKEDWEAERAIQELDGSWWCGSKLTVQKARKQKN
jgi:RNA recognition motif-containing protein